MLAQDIVSLGGYSVASQTFAACHEISSGLISSSVSGIMGLSWQSLAYSKGELTSLRLGVLVAYQSRSCSMVDHNGVVLVLVRAAVCVLPGAVSGCSGSDAKRREWRAGDVWVLGYVVFDFLPLKLITRQTRPCTLATSLMFPLLRTLSTGRSP